MCAHTRENAGAVTNPYAPAEPRDYLWNQLAELPYFRALLRAVESRYYADLPMVAPVLDLGSGDGSFARQTFGRPLDVGIDPWKPPMAEARRVGAHAALALAEGAHMPFADASFNTVISNSVLEHIPAIEPVVAEVGRVLKPGGRFMFCGPNERFTEFHVGGKLLGEGYRNWFNKIARHARLDSEAVWRERLVRHGFEVEQAWHYFSPRATRTLEMGHYLGLPNLITKRLFGQWVLFPSRANPALRALYAWLKPIYNEPTGMPATQLFVVARKREV
ncbi:MAG: class I SAM-dependent methyltransferase [Thermoflexales bacterium]|nr:class I SAM-dependent methyltransferase [Thermoflexales bacterium]